MEKRIQQLLAIGIDNYRSAAFDTLYNAVSDSRLVIDVLQTRYGMELAREPIWNASATRANILAAFNELVAALDDRDDLIIYFAGHGRQHTLIGTGYWMPYDATDDVASYISNSEIKDFLGGMKARHVLLIADACFSGTFITRTRGEWNDKSYASLDKVMSRWVLASGGEETVSDGSKGASSPFAKYLLRYLNSNTNAWTSVAEFCRYVCVLTGNNARQRPQAARIEGIGDAGGELIFRLKDEWVQTRQAISSGEPPTLSLRQELRAIVGSQHKMATGKEIVLVESIVEGKEPKDLIVLELFRFNDQGEKKVQFKEGELLMPGKDGVLAWTLIQRFATWTGFQRYWEKEKGRYDGRQVVTARASEEIDQVEDTDAALRQHVVLDDLRNQNASVARCLHCGATIDRHERILVEIDEVGLRPNFGHVHPGCLRPADRILGVAQLPEEYGIKGLVDFDIDRWLQALSVGHGLMAGSRKIAEKRGGATIAWNKDNINNEGDYCIRLYLEDGTAEWLHLGRRIQRFFRGVIDEEVATFNRLILEAIEEGNPWAYTSERRLFGTTTELDRQKNESEVILRIERAEKTKYSSQMEPETRIENDYAPVCLLLDPDTGKIVVLSSYVPLISNPLEFEEIRRNWNRAGYEVGECAARVITSDKDLDLTLSECWGEGMQPVIDPQFNSDADLIAGMPIVNIKEIVERKESQEGIVVEDSKWKGGDRVDIILPGHEVGPHPTGILLTGELMDEEGNKFVIFSPVEGGVVRQDLQFSIRSSYLRRSADMPPGST